MAWDPVRTVASSRGRSECPHSLVIIGVGKLMDAHPPKDDAESQPSDNDGRWAS